METGTATSKTGTPSTFLQHGVMLLRFREPLFKLSRIQHKRKLSEQVIEWRFLNLTKGACEKPQ